MNIAKLLLSGLLGTAVLASACSVERLPEENPDDPNQGYYFVGYVYDGVNAETLTDYTLEVTYDEEIDEFTEGMGGANATTNREASVDANGRYRVGPIGLYSDFTVEIVADGYRSFLSHNNMRTNVGGPDRQETELFEAYLFPENIETEALTLEVFSEIVGADRPSGSVRLVPTNGNGESSLSLQGTLGASVSNQMWTNDLDAHNATVVVPITDGTVNIEAGALVYGVTYTATLFGVAGHQYESFNLTAGLTGNQTVVLDELQKDGLQLISVSTDDNTVDEDGTLVVTFNKPIEFARTLSAELIAERVDDAFSISSPDADGDFNGNVLTFTDEPDAQEKGTSVTIEGNTLTLSWANQPSNFEFQDVDDPILSVTYSNLFFVQLQEVGEPESPVYSLSNFIGSSETVFLVPQPSL